jgi:hypothetical protein
LQIRDQWKDSVNSTHLFRAELAECRT